jgi:hypothetical protein
MLRRLFVKVSVPVNVRLDYTQQTKKLYRLFGVDFIEPANEGFCKKC